MARQSLGLLLYLLLCSIAAAAPPEDAAIWPLGPGWAKNKVNTAIFRHASIVSNQHRQIASYYDPDGGVILAQRKLNGNDWQIVPTELTGNVEDAHNVISLGLDGADRLHISWNHHGSPLHYAVETEPGSLKLRSVRSMTGRRERRVTYPQFLALPDGDLLFLYRRGASGRGDLVINRYDHQQAEWQRLSDNLIDGQGERNAYWQAAVDSAGAIHLSWVWRETWDASTNHDLAYARSDDGGRTWQRSTGEAYELPITEATAEVAVRIPQESDLINQTSMDVDGQGRPWIASYWRPEDSEVPQYQIVRLTDSGWQVEQPFERSLDFTLGGGGTLRIPVARPLLLIDRDRERAMMIFRDEERGSRASAAICDDISLSQWQVVDLSEERLGEWEPTCDPQAWHARGALDLMFQFCGQGDHETLEEVPPQPVSVFHWKPW